ncbi:MAG: hypothetical protein M1608_01680, partial [Candidatus Omnitrophica bacterium]|nr:hypothetical protein [Candidatus Omnitrophota bacterium]
GVADRRVDLEGQDAGTDIARYDIYRDTTADFAPSPRFLVGETTGNAYSDTPRSSFAAWGNRVEPDTTYYYRVVAVDHWNNAGPPAESVSVTTPDSGLKNAVPSRVTGLHAYLVSPVSTNNLVGLWFYTNPESDVSEYRVYRGSIPGFTADQSTLLATLDARRMFHHVTPHAFKTVDRSLKEYDRQVLADEDVQPDSTYFYKICAVDAAGQAGPLSEEVHVHTKALP